MGDEQHDAGIPESPTSGVTGGASGSEPQRTPTQGPAPSATPSAPATSWTPPAPGEQHWARGARRGGVAFGLVLIAIGLVVLVGRFVPSFDVVRLWPLIVVLAGLVHMFTPRNEVLVKRVAEGLGTVAVGLVLLGNTFGYIQWTVWVTMLSLWPLLLVALGVELLGRGLHMNWLRAMSNVILILGLVYGVFVLGPGWSGTGNVFGIASTATPFQASAPHDAAVHDGDASVKVGATALTLRAGDRLAAISGAAPQGDQPHLDASTTGGTANVSVTEPSGSHVYFVPTNAWNLDVVLDSAVTWRTLRMDFGAVKADADLRDLAVESVALNVGASDVRLTLGKKAPDVKVDVSGGVTSVTILVPADASVSLDARSGLSAVNVPSSFRRISGVPGFGESSWTAEGTGGPHIAVTMQSGIANLNIETY
jgi:hypothetical protein